MLAYLLVVAEESSPANLAAPALRGLKHQRNLGLGRRALAGWNAMITRSGRNRGGGVLHSTTARLAHQHRHWRLPTPLAIGQTLTGPRPKFTLHHLASVGAGLWVSAQPVPLQGLGGLTSADRPPPCWHTTQ